MRIYLEKSGEKAGPFTLFQVEEGIREETVKGETLAWYEGCEGWQRLDELVPFDRMFERMREEQALARVREIPDLPESPPDGLGLAWRPWLRFAARLFDHMMVAHAVVGIAYFAELATAIEIRYDLIAQSGFLLLVGWMIVESFCLAAYGKTPGKWIMGLEVVRKDGGRLDLATCFRRSLSVLVIGQGMGLLGVRQVAELIQYFIVRRTGTAFWDKGLGLKVSCRKIHWARALMPIAGMMLVSTTVLHDPYERMLEEILEEVGRVVEEAKRQRGG